MKKWTIDDGDIRKMASEAAKRRLESLNSKYDSLGSMGKKTAEKSNLEPLIAKNMASLADDIFVNHNVATILMKMSYGDVEKKCRQELEESQKRLKHWESKLAITSCDCKLREAMPRTSMADMYRAGIEIRLETEIQFELGLLLAPIKWGKES